FRSERAAVTHRHGGDIRPRRGGGCPVVHRREIILGSRVRQSPARRRAVDLVLLVRHRNRITFPSTSAFNCASKPISSPEAKRPGRSRAFLTPPSGPGARWTPRRHPPQ